MKLIEFQFILAAVYGAFLPYQSSVEQSDRMSMVDLLKMRSIRLSIELVSEKAGE